MPMSAPQGHVLRHAITSQGPRPGLTTLLEPAWRTATIRLALIWLTIPPGSASMIAPSPTWPTLPQLRPNVWSRARQAGSLMILGSHTGSVYKSVHPTRHNLEILTWEGICAWTCVRQEHSETKRATGCAEVPARLLIMPKMMVFADA